MLIPAEGSQVLFARIVFQPASLLIANDTHGFLAVLKGSV